jgi:manganese-dependent inorganic pyrophosphatase
MRTDKTLVTCYVNPDLDGVAGATAYAEFLNKKDGNTVVGIIGEPHDEVKYILDRFKIPYPMSIPNADDFEKVILVDASDLIGLEEKIAPEKVIEIIDHRKINEADKFVNAKAQIELVGAAATLVAEKFIENEVEISKESAILLLGAIISNTLNFKGTVTTDRDRKAAEYLNKVARLDDNFWKELFTAKSDLSGSKLAERMRGDFAWFVIGKKKVGIAQIEIIGAEKLVTERGDEIVRELESIKLEMGLDLVFQTTIGLDENMNVFVTGDAETRAILEKVLNVKFNGNIAKPTGLIMRKQIVPLLKGELEGV